MTSERLTFPKELHYSTKVLIGNWQNDRIKEAEEKKAMEKVSAYKNDYNKKPLSSIDEGKVWDCRFEGEGQPLWAPMTIEECPNFYCNYATAYDLSFRHVPSLYEGPVKKRYRFRLEKREPEDILLESYGNITSCGLTEEKRKEWSCQAEGPRMKRFSWYRAEYQTPNASSYVLTRYSASARLNSRKKGQKVCNDPRDHKQNPITWIPIVCEKCPR